MSQHFRYQTLIQWSILSVDSVPSFSLHNGKRNCRFSILSFTWEPLKVTNGGSQMCFQTQGSQAFIVVSTLLLSNMTLKLYLCFYHSLSPCLSLILVSKTYNPSLYRKATTKTWITRKNVRERNTINKISL